MKIDIAVCGRFHYHKYVKYIAQKGILNKIYFSYKRKFDFGLEKKYLQNYPLKEYLMYFNIRFLKGWRIEKNTLWLHEMWEKQVSNHKPKADILHIMIHGNSEKIIQKYKDSGKIVIGEAVNVFPSEQLDIMEKEYAKYDMKKKKTVDAYTKEKMIREFKACDYILTASNFVRNSFIKHGFAKEKFLLIPYGSEINKERSFKKTVPENNIKILCVGQITFRKGQIYLLNAIQQLQKENIECELTLVGVLDEEYQSCLKKEELDDFYQHIEHVPNDQIEEFMSTFDLFVLPSIEDGFGIVVTESLSVGVPVITTISAGASDIIEDDKNGYKVLPSSSNSIVDAIKKSRGKTFIMDNAEVIDWHEYANQLIKKYEVII